MACETERAYLQGLLDQVPIVMAQVSEAVTRLNTLISQIESARQALVLCESSVIPPNPPGP
jgi:hypothetical protein